MYGVYRFKNKLCLVAPWMENGDIGKYLKKNPRANRHSLCADIVQGLQYLHKEGIVHGDLKGANILIHETGKACLSDFGISGVLDSNIVAWTSQSSVASKGGSVRWQAPELDMEKDEEVINSPYSDVYALGCVFYEVFTGNIPFHHISRDTTVVLQIQRGIRPSRPSELDAAWREWGLTEEIWALCGDCWKNEPKERPSVEDVSRRLPTTPLRLNEKLTLEHTLSPVYFRGRMCEPLDETSKSISKKLLDNIVYSPRLTLSSTYDANKLTAQFHGQEIVLPSQLHSSAELTDIPMDKDPLAQNTNPKYTYSKAGFSIGLSRPLKSSKQERLAQCDKLEFFLATAPSAWDMAGDDNGQDRSRLPLFRFLLPSGEYVSCVLWKGLFHITGTDIAFGRPVRDMKKFEKGVFSDLRNLKPGSDACSEESKVFRAA
ncbi:hypothetical protein C0989_009145 [Termitomyces sp. Mn162]|nr:hypothetical protein C0989_009145 [Termitomyces sp. Mn162]